GAGKPRRRRNSPAQGPTCGLVDLLSKWSELPGLRNGQDQAAPLGGFRVCNFDFHGLQSEYLPLPGACRTIAAPASTAQSAAPSIRRIFFADQALLSSSRLWRQGAESLYCAPCAGFLSISCGRSP